MSLYGTLNVGVSALYSQSNRIGIISDNIANVNTVGYRAGTGNFEDLITGNTVPTYMPSGVKPDDRQSNTLQGQINSANVSTDIAISGPGFFAVSPTSALSNNLLYTRAGSFRPDGDGNFVNSSGYYLQGWPLNADGELPAALNTAVVDAGTAIGGMKTVNVAKLTELPVVTDKVSIHANLSSSSPAYAGTPVYSPTDNTANMVSGSVVPTSTLPVTAVDSKGVAHTLTAAFLKTGNNNWAVEIYPQTPGDVTTATPPGPLASGNIVFNNDGTLGSVDASLMQPIAVNWSDGATSSSITYNWGTQGQVFGTPGATAIGRDDGLSQYASSFTLKSVDQNGSQAGTLSGVSVTSEGFVVGNYSNNTTRQLYKIPLANFIEPNKLDGITGNVFAQSTDSGVANFMQPGKNGIGKLQGDALEASNVDISVELTTMIVAQNAYQAGSKLISTSDTMLQSLVSMGTN